MELFVAYYRVSRHKQGKDGLGMLGQKRVVQKYISSNEGQIISEFTEIETGTRKKRRVEIYKAIEFAKKNNATLLVAKLDRLTRDVQFTSALYNGNVDFVCCDNPHANKLTIQLLSIIAENEAEDISKRIKAALFEKKEKIKKGNYINKDGSEMKPINGKVRLGNPNGFGEFQTLGVLKIKENAKSNKANLQAADLVCSARREGLSFQAIADKLNKLQYTTRHGKAYSAMQVKRLADTFCNGFL